MINFRNSISACALALIVLPHSAFAGAGWEVTLKNTFSGQNMVGFTGLTGAYDGCWQDDMLSSPFVIASNSANTYYTEEDWGFGTCLMPDQWSVNANFSIMSNGAMGMMVVYLVTPDDNGPNLPNTVQCGGPNDSYVGWAWSDGQSHPAPTNTVLTCSYDENRHWVTLTVDFPQP